MNQNDQKNALAPAGQRIIAAIVDYVIYGVSIGIIVATVWAFTGYDNILESILVYAMAGIVTEAYIAYSLVSIISALVS